ncbi:prepilin-type N-terminal cleavage/methylation domain-containing protein [uncultured Tolumonas sp.]|uniref:pilin n=1 Tax=uncultured Tolumonas sp. TaxID=263765 RepID=UPI002A0A9194|nr:prepilin-type N-terminal cleavage/methylation domain-containing protein [uncultured Tolumonas sp.]
MKKQSGFTLIELMIVVAIVAILAAVAMPAYQTYTAKARFSEVVNSVNPIKAQVELCYLNTQAFTACDLGASGEGWSFKAAAADYAAGHVASISVTDGKILVTADTTGGLNGQTYSIEPTATNGSVVWALSATAANITCRAQDIC